MFVANLSEKHIVYTDKENKITQLKGTWIDLDTYMPTFTLSDGKKFGVDYVFLSYNTTSELDENNYPKLKILVDKDSSSFQVNIGICAFSTREYRDIELKAEKENDGVRLTWKNKININKGIVEYLVSKNNKMIEGATVSNTRSNANDQLFKNESSNYLDKDTTTDGERTYCVFAKDRTGLVIYLGETKFTYKKS